MKMKTIIKKLQIHKSMDDNNNIKLTKKGNL